MGYTCGPAAERLTAYLGFPCQHANAVVTFRNPFTLANGTMPVLELLIVAGAIWALVHAWRRWRHDGDPVNLTLWFGSVVYLAVVEPPLYFPEWFGLSKYVGFIFAHNVFTVQFMYDRLPLYIVCFYPAFSQLAYEVVRALGVFARRGAFIGAVTVAFACQVFYEIFDQLGPQLKWWAWNPGDRLVNAPALASVPMNSMVLFASVSFAAMTYLAVRLTGDSARSATGWQVAWRAVVAGVLAPLAMMIVSAPSGAFGAAGQAGVQRVILGAELAVIWIAGLYLSYGAWRAIRAGQATPARSPLFARVYPAVYLAVLAGLWASALPAWFAAKDGLTAQGTPTGSLWYVAACAVAAVGLITAAYRATANRAAGEPAGRHPVGT